MGLQQPQWASTAQPGPMVGMTVEHYNALTAELDNRAKILTELESEIRELRGRIAREQWGDGPDEAAVKTAVLEALGSWPGNEWAEITEAIRDLRNRALDDRTLRNEADFRLEAIARILNPDEDDD